MGTKDVTKVLDEARKDPEYYRRLQEIKNSPEFAEKINREFKRHFHPEGEDRIYHCEMLLLEIECLERPGGDTRGYLSIDRPEQAILFDLLTAEIWRLKDRSSAPDKAPYTEPSPSNR